MIWGVYVPGMMFFHNRERERERPIEESKKRESKKEKRERHRERYAVEEVHNFLLFLGLIGLGLFSLVAFSYV